MELKKNLSYFYTCNFFTQTVFRIDILVSHKIYRGLFRGLF